MQRKKLSIILLSGGILAIIVTGLAMVTTQPAKACSAQGPSAQCGSQVSSCKNCHETQGKKPVSNDGTGWHQSHAFGDFCAICHGGNQQATDEKTAHTGVVSPLSDVKAACQQCHPSDYETRAQVYAATLNVKLDLSATAAPTAQQAASTSPTPAPQTVAAIPAGGAKDTSLVDYVQRYDQNVLGQTPTNWGNVILLAMLVLMIIAGAALVLRRENWVKVSLSFNETKPLDKAYPADVVELASEIDRLKPGTRKSLRRLLAKPAAPDLLASLDKLSDDDE